MYTHQDIKCLASILAPVAATGAISDPAAIVSTLEGGLTPGKPAEEWMSKAEVMAFFNIKEATYYDWLRRSWLIPHGKGRKVKFKKSEVLARRIK